MQWDHITFEITFKFTKNSLKVHTSQRLWGRVTCYVWTTRIDRKTLASILLWIIPGFSLKWLFLGLAFNIITEAYFSLRNRRRTGNKRRALNTHVLCSK